MTTTYPNPQHSPSLDPIESTNYEVHDQHITFSSPSSQAGTSSYSTSCSLSSSFPICFNSIQDLREGFDREGQHEGFQKYVLHGGSSSSYSSIDDQQLCPSPLPVVETDGSDQNDNGGLKFTIYSSKQEAEDDDHNKGNENGSSSIKWMSSKMRLMKKMKNNNPNRTVRETTTKIKYDHDMIRVCTDCNTTKTPLWRSGPRGPKTLCNACGIRQRKARRAMAAATAATIHHIEPMRGLNQKVINKMMKRSPPSSSSKDEYDIIPYKKRCKVLSPSHSLVDTNNTNDHTKSCFEDFIINLMNKQNNSDFHQVFPQDEHDAAILLMALSCGLVHG